MNNRYQPVLVKFILLNLISNKGYTLVELLVVLALVGLLSLVTVPATTSHWRRQVIEQAAQDLAADIRLAQSRAVNSLAYQIEAGISSCWGLLAGPDCQADYCLVTQPDCVPANYLIYRAAQFDNEQVTIGEGQVMFSW